MSMRSHRVPEEYVRWTKLLYAKPTSVVRCAAGTSRSFRVEVGVHQALSLTPAVHPLHGYDNEGNPEAASVCPTLCRRCHARVGVSRRSSNKYSLGRIGCSNMDCASMYPKLSTRSADQG
ncbi:hypothetical protein RB195_024998 [Necator americanus]|uniref:Uncharacterized protein n=1 Tax=Necator americanus TaxID=51031 RepID=A0ABR1EQJ3_NECAM